MRSEPPIGDELARLLESMKTTVLERTADEPAAASRGPIAKRVTGIVLGIAALLGLGAGAAFAFGVLPGGGPAPSAPPEPPAATAPRPTTSVPPIEYEVTPGPPPGRVQPASAYAIGCADLASPEVIAGLFMERVDAVDPIVDGSGVGIAIPRVAPVLEVGGLACTWSNGVAYDQYGDVPGYRGIRILVVPQAESGWSGRASIHKLPQSGSACSTDGTSFCGAAAVVGHSWIEMEGYGLDPARWDAVVAAVSAAVANAGSPAAPIAAPVDDTLVDCSARPSVETLAGVTGANGVYEGTPAGGAGGGWSSWAEASLISGWVSCSWGATDGELAGVRSALDGRWAYERMLLAGRSEPVTISGLAFGDEATLRCEASFGDGCAVDLAIGDDWLNVYGRDRATAIAVAEAVVAHGVR